MDTPNYADLMSQVQSLADRVHKIERIIQGTTSLPPDKFWALHALAQNDDGGGRIVYAGVLETPKAGRVAWQKEAAVAELLKADWTQEAPVLGALGHPIRLAILKSLLMGSQTIQELLEIPGLGTSGQLYHHLRELQAVGWVHQERRNYYAIPKDQIVPLLVIIAIALS
ncbi:ArsR/SmtB family transcription factor [Calidithermus timidus]|uniref:ArsR/SmtB family transcription factor n=1 Tax=Calidithermus timidus TaxID=307124 RepID=UPI0004778B16|nr:winged helix-turn-helix domain-containing protein [Calidithermus timidus]